MPHSDKTQTLQPFLYIANILLETWFQPQGGYDANNTDIWCECVSKTAAWNVSKDDCIAKRHLLEIDPHKNMMQYCLVTLSFSLVELSYYLTHQNSDIYGNLTIIIAMSRLKIVPYSIFTKLEDYVTFML